MIFISCMQGGTDMDNHDWIILKTLSETKNLTQAARQLFMTQPALTYRLQNIEKEFNIKIFERHSKGLVLTSQGKHFIRYAKSSLAELDILKKTLHPCAVPTKGCLRLGISTVFAKFKIAPILKQFHKEYPHITISLKTGSSMALLPELLKNDKIDVAIMRNNYYTDNVEQHVISEEPMYFVCTHPITNQELTNTPWITYETSQMTHSYEISCRWWQETFHTIPPASIWVNSVEAALSLIKNGLGWGIISGIWLPKSAHIYTAPLYIHGHLFLRKTLIAYKKEKSECLPVKSFVNMVKSDFSNI